MRAGEQACNPASRQLGRSQRGRQRIFIIQRNTRKNTSASSYTKRQAGRDRQAGRQRDRPRQIDSARPCNPMERLASRQHLGRIIESLEKTGALEPLSCVNVALQILSLCRLSRLC